MKFKNPFANLTRFELVLWLTSVFVIVLSFIFSHGNGILTAVSSVIGVTALIFVAKGYVLGQVLTVVFAVFYGLISFYLRYYGEMITYLCMTSPMAVAAIITWIKNPFNGTKQVKIHRLTAKQTVVMIFWALLTTVAFYFILRYLGNANLTLSTISVTTSFVASYLTYLRSPYYALGYAANDIVLIVLWILAVAEDISYLPMVFCFVMFLLNDLYGFYNWKRMQKNQMGK